MTANHDPDYWAFSNEDGKLERCDMRQFVKDLDAAVAYSKRLEHTCTTGIPEGQCEACYTAASRPDEPASPTA